MKHLLILFFIILAYSCSKVENRSAMTSDDLIGTWIDTIAHKTYPIINGNIDTVVYNSATYTFLSNGTFTTENDFPLGLVNGGQWSFDQALNKIIFVPKPTLADSIFLSVKSYTWQIEDFDENYLNVVYRFTEDRVLPSGVSPDISIYRSLIKQ
jgi:hypothetical protein